MNNIFFLTFIFSYLLVPTSQLICLTGCSTIQIQYPFHNLSERSSCIRNTLATVCKGRIVAYYKGETFPKYINYTFGTTHDPLETKYEDDVDTHGLDTFNKYQVIVNATNEESIIIADIYCTAKNECASSEIENLFTKYMGQVNPFYELQPLIYISPSPKNLSCYNVSTNKNEQCSASNGNPVCMSYLKSFKQECSFSTDIHLHEEFTVTTPSALQFNRMSELVKCNKDNCNSMETLSKIQNITRLYAYGIVTKQNNADRPCRIAYQMFYVLLCMVFIFRSACIQCNI
ncbi:unnamed protein product [Rotaria magnacalcarata]|uniref:Uncharacterized protein n=1 Tax=Rotaria magnacalcarata TaxID=392030 RepID=A0A816LR38_9BILA|nr:unnamed protein product [Rotaria magnacalcarata]CAF4912777.1 unnamed protein product [Rotaria magnacalcarata]